MLHAVSDGRHLQSLAREGEVPKTSIACAPTDMLVASAARDGSVHVWDGYTGTPAGSYQLHEVSPAPGAGGDCLLPASFIGCAPLQMDKLIKQKR